MTLFRLPIARAAGEASREVVFLLCCAEREMSETPRDLSNLREVSANSHGSYSAEIIFATKSKPLKR